MHYEGFKVEVVSCYYIRQVHRPPDKRVYWKFFLFLIQNICCGYSKELSQGDGSFEHPKHVFKLMGKKIITILRT